MRDLRVMSPRSYRTAPHRVVDIGVSTRRECETGTLWRGESLCTQLICCSRLLTPEQCRRASTRPDNGFHNVIMQTDTGESTFEAVN
jgi:hypothetical protein